MAESATLVALLVAGLALNPQGRAIRLDMANASARKALLVSEGSGQRAGRRFVTWLLAVEAESFFSTVGGKVTNITTLVTSLPDTEHPYK